VTQAFLEKKMTKTDKREFQN